MVKIGEIWGGIEIIKIIKMDTFQYFSIKSCCGCVLESPHRGDSNTHPKHMLLWRTYDN